MEPEVKLTGRVVFQSHPGYEEARKNFNARFDRYPRVVVYCQNVQDVMHAVKWARQHHVPLRVRSGGHSYEAFSLANGSIVVDLSDMQAVCVDKNRGIATVQAGIRMLPLYEALWKKGVTLPAGASPSTGLAGLTLGGGFGYISRKFGMTCDSLLEVELVNACGERMCASETQNSDLLWAMRGGGAGSFGIVTSFTFKVHPVSDVAMYRIHWHWRHFHEVVEAWQSFAPETDERLTSLLKLPALQKENKIASSGQFVGLEKELRPLLEPLLAAGRAESVTVRSASYIEAVRFFAGVRPEQKEWTVHQVKRTKFKNTSAFAYETFDETALAELQRNLESSPHAGNVVQLDAYGGAIDNVAPEDTAFFHRGSKFSLQYQAYWERKEEEAENIRWVRQFRTSMLPYTRGAYYNYCDIDIPDWGDAYFGTNFSCLREIKSKYDPEDFFHFEQSIPPAEPSTK